MTIGITGGLTGGGGGFLSLSTLARLRQAGMTTEDLLCVMRREVEALDGGPMARGPGLLGSKENSDE